MTEFNGYAVFFFPNALEALGETVAPYLQDSPGGQHILCRDIDLGGALTQLTLEGRTTAGGEVDLELMFPTNMVRMVVSARTDPAFGFGPRAPVTAAPQAPLVDDGAPGPAHPPGEAPPRTVPGHAARAAKAARTAKKAKKVAKKTPSKKTPAKKASAKSPGASSKKAAGKAATPKG